MGVQCITIVVVRLLSIPRPLEDDIISPRSARYRPLLVFSGFGMPCRPCSLKVEYLNPGGTSKDRIAASMIQDAEESGKLAEGGTVVEGTSGSTGICLASLCRAKGYRCVIVMPDDQVSYRPLNGRCLSPLQNTSREI